MTTIREMYPSPYLSVEDIVDSGPTVVTIAAVRHEEVPRKGLPPVMKWVVHFKKCKKKLITCRESGEQIMKVLRADHCEDWVGGTIELFHDTAVRTENGQGGIRVREAKA